MTPEPRELEWLVQLLALRSPDSVLSSKSFAFVARRVLLYSPFEALLKIHRVVRMSDIDNSTKGRKSLLTIRWVLVLVLIFFAPDPFAMLPIVAVIFLQPHLLFQRWSTQWDFYRRSASFLCTHLGYFFPSK